MAPQKGRVHQKLKKKTNTGRHHAQVEASQTLVRSPGRSNVFHVNGIPPDRPVSVRLLRQVRHLYTLISMFVASLPPEGVGVGAGGATSKNGYDSSRAGA